MQKGSLLRVALIGAMVSFGGSMVASSALADIITETLGVGNAAISGFPPPYGTVSINRTDTTHATITFTEGTAPAPACTTGCTYLFGGNGAVAVNVNATSFTLSGLTGTSPGASFSSVVADLSDGGAGTEDGFGSFNQTINNFDGFTHSWATITFTLTNTSGTWASASNVLTTGINAAAHTFVTASPALASNGAIQTGFSAVPGPILGGGIPGLVMACGGLLALARRRRQRIV